MQKAVLWISLLIAAAFTAGAAGEAADDGRLTLDRALEEAFRNSPELQQALAELRAAEARLLTARTFPYNPELTVEAARRRSGDAATTDRTVTLSQQFEIAGQRRLRTSAQRSEVSAAASRVCRAERQLAARVEAAFLEALRRRERLAIARSGAELARDLAGILERRFDAGAATLIDVNLARVQQRRAETKLRLARAAYAAAKAVLAETIGRGPERAPDPAGTLQLPRRELPPLTELLAAARQRRADLEALRTSVEAARQRIRAAQRERVPDLVVEAFRGREEAVDRLAGVSLGISIPLFNRKRGEIALARAESARSESAAARRQLEVGREVARARAFYQELAAVAHTFSGEVLEAFRDNVALLGRAFRAGKVGLGETLVFRRELIDAQTEAIDAVADALLAGVELDLAIGARPCTTVAPDRPAAAEEELR